MGQGRVIPQKKFNALLKYTFGEGRNQNLRDAARNRASARTQVGRDGYYSQKAASFDQAANNNSYNARLLDHNIELQKFYTEK